MLRRRVSGTSVALALSALALFVSLGGPAWARRVLVGTRDLHDNAVTSRKIAPGAVRNSDLGGASVGTAKLRNGAVATGKLADGAVTNGKLGADAVTSDKVTDGSLTAGDVAPGTFLAAGGTATDANALGGFPAAQYLRGSLLKRVVLDPDQATGTLLTFPLGSLTGSCTGDDPVVSYSNASSPVDVVLTALSDSTKALSPVQVKAQASLGAGGTLGVPNQTTGEPQMVMVQAAAVSSPPRVLSAWVSSQYVPVTGCVFIVQQTSTG